MMENFKITASAQLCSTSSMRDLSEPSDQESSWSWTEVTGPQEQPVASRGRPTVSRGRVFARVTVMSSIYAVPEDPFNKLFKA